MLRIVQFQGEVCWIGALRSQHKGFSCGILKANHLIRRPENVKVILLQQNIIDVDTNLFGCNSGKLGKVRALLTEQE